MNDKEEPPKIDGERIERAIKHIDQLDKIDKEIKNVNRLHSEGLLSLLEMMGIGVNK